MKWTGICNIISVCIVGRMISDKLCLHNNVSELNVLLADSSLLGSIHPDLKPFKQIRGQVLKPQNTTDVTLFLTSHAIQF